MLHDHVIQLKQTIAVAAPSSVDSYGKRTYGSVTAGIAARVEPFLETVDGGPGSGQQRVTRTRVITATAVAEFSRVWVPPDEAGSDATKARIALSVHTRTGLDGSVNHYEVIL